MFPASFEYHRATSFADASRALRQFGPDARLMAGGQTLIPMLKLRLVRPSHLVDLGGVVESRGVELGPDALVIGALATHAAIAGSPAASRFPIVADCGGGIADAQVRNLGTVGGSLAEADPCGCWPTLLSALDARVRCSGPDGERTVAVRELLRDAYSPALRDAELLAEVVVDRAALDGDGAFVAFKRAAAAYPTASCALQLQMRGEVVERVRLALGCVAMTPVVVDEATAILQGERPSAALVGQVADAAARQAQPLSDNKGSEEYKRSLVRGLVARAFEIVQRRRAGQPHPPTHTYYG